MKIIALPVFLYSFDGSLLLQNVLHMWKIIEL